MNNTKIIAINGPPRSGKNTFVDFCEDVDLGLYVSQISSVDHVKHLATTWGWDGSKTPRNRQHLSNLKDMLEEWGDIPNKKIEEYISRLSFFNTPQILFVHVREPHNIQQLKTKYNAITILVVNSRVEQETSNHADEDVYCFEYDYVIDNNGDLDRLKESAETFMKLFV